MKKNLQNIHQEYHRQNIQEQFTAFSLALESANQSIVNRYGGLKLLVFQLFFICLFRTKFVREIYQSMEQGLTLIGATGIEDRLQDKVLTAGKIQKRVQIQIQIQNQEVT